MKNLYRRYSQSERYRKSRLSKKEKLKFFLEILPISLSIIGSVYVTFMTNKVQINISNNNRIVQKELNNLKQQEINLNNSNSYPAFTFSLEKTGNEIMYTLNKTKGEMNNVNFLVYEVITGNGTYDNKPLQIQQSLRFTQKDSLTEFQATYPTVFDAEQSREKINALLRTQKINASVDFLYIQRYYDVSYMNFEHEFKQEYYTIGKNGIGKSIEYPYQNTYQNNDSIKFNGGFSGKYDDEIDDDWLANKLFNILKIPSPYN